MCISICIYIYIYIWCVCAWNIWIDVKLLTLIFLQGDHPCTVSDGPTKRPQYMRISWLITVTYLLHSFDVNVQKWRPAKPRTGTSTNWSSNSFFARFSQPELPLSFENEWAASERVVWFPSHGFSPLIFQLLLSGFTEVFFANTTHSTSVRYFWASVWFMLDSPRWHEPLGESLSRLKIDTLKRPLNWHFWLGNLSK